MAMIAVRLEKQDPRCVIFWCGSPGTKTIMASHAEPWPLDKAKQYVDAYNEKHPDNPLAVYAVTGRRARKVYPKEASR